MFLQKTLFYCIKTLSKLYSINKLLYNKKQLLPVVQLERVVGIEPTFPAWKAGVLPIYDTRI